MANWQFFLGLSALCVLTGCGDALKPQQQPPAGQDEPPEIIATQPETAVLKSAPRDEQSAASNTVAQQDTTIIPGERVGPVTGNTSRADLAAIYGEEALTDSEIPVGEGFTESGTQVHTGTEQAFSVIWVDESQTQPATVKDFGSAWETPEGIRLGTPFTELQTTLGTFDLYGFGWDYGGTVVLEGSDLSHYYGSLILRLSPADPNTVQQQAEAFQAVQGDKLIASENANLPALGLEVSEIIVYLNPPVE